MATHDGTNHGEVFVPVSSLRAAEVAVPFSMEPVRALVQQAMLKKGLNVHQCEIQAEISQGSLGRFLRGERDLRTNSFWKVCNVLGLRFVDNAGNVVIS